MSQYKEGRVNVSNGSGSVTGVGTSFAGNVLSGDLFSIKGSGVFYTVASTPGGATALAITPVYAGTSGSNLEYEIVRDFTPRASLPKPSNNDNDAALVVGRAMDMIDATFYESDGTPKIYEPPPPGTGGIAGYTLQLFTATEAQTLFTLTGGFTYTVGMHQLLVFADGKFLIPTVDFTETSTTSFTMTAPLPLNTEVVALILTVPEA